LIIEPKVFEDQRGRFLETYHRRRYAEHGMALNFPQDNVSFSRQGSLRGLHYQLPCGQAKLVHVMRGEVLDVAVDIRRGSPTFGRWVSRILSGKNLLQIYIPAGFAHGFCVLSEEAIFAYKCSDLYAPDCEKGILWSDPDLGIDWPLKEPLVSEKDSRLPRLKDIPPESLPRFSPE
jgi:dTDP-4-dehydrorhamnose 3,5-epimerase